MPHYDWRARLLAALNAPVNDLTVLCLGLWAQSEGMPASYYNWLATAKPWPGSTIVNSSGVRAYASQADGVNATAATIRQTNMHTIIVPLRAGKDAEAIWSGINDSPWCKGCQHGKYPVALFDYIAAHGSTPRIGRGDFTAGRNPGPGTDDYSAKVRHGGQLLHHTYWRSIQWRRALGGLRK